MEQPDAPGTQQETFRICTPGALAALVPHLLGFMPASSIVVIGTTASGSVKVTLRYDLPGRGDAVGTAADVLAILAAQELTAAVAVGYGPEPLVTPAADALRQAADHADIDLREILRVEDNRYWSYICANPACCPADGIPLDYTAIPASTRTSEYGLVVLPSRDALAATVAPLGGRARQSMRQATRQARQHAGQALAQARASDRPAAALKAIAEEGITVVMSLITAYRDGSPRISNDKFAKATVALKAKRVRDDAYARMDPEHAQAHQQMWTDMVRRAEPGYVTGPACLLAFVAWQTGYGALANVALDRAFADDPDDPIAQMLRTIINAGAPPSLARFEMTAEQVATSYDNQDTGWT